MTPSLAVVLQALTCGILVPGLIAAAGLLLAPRCRVAAPAAVAVGLCAGCAALSAVDLLGWGFLTVSSNDSWDRLPGPALLAVVLCPARPGAAGMLRLVGFGASALTGWLLVRAESVAGPAGLGWAAGIAGSVMALWGVLERAAARWPGFGLPALLALVAFGTAFVCAASGNFRLAHLAGVLGAVLAGGALAAWLRPEATAAGAAVPALAVLLPGVLFLSSRNNFGDVPQPSFLLLVSSPLLLGVASLLPFGGRSLRTRMLVCAGATLLPLGAGVALAALA